jgi:hypothetical protein
MGYHFSMPSDCPRLIAAFCSAAVLSCCAAHAQTERATASVVAGIPVNYDEARVGA